MSGDDVLVETLAKILHERLDKAGPGHCVRVDDVEARLAARLAGKLAGRVEGTAVHILRAQPSEAHEIRPERAVEIRNRKKHKCLLLVPDGEGHAASSLDNSFERLPSLDLYHTVYDRLLRRKTLLTWASSVKSVVRETKRAGWEPRARFVTELYADPTAECFGRSLWLLGLAPDLGSEPWERVPMNYVAVRAISAPKRPTSGLDERFTAGGLREGDWRDPLRSFCTQAGADLATATVWCRRIAEEYPQLSFDTWQLAGTVEEAIDAVRIEPFLTTTGKPVGYCGLELSAGGELELRAAADGQANMGLRWKTEPKTVAGVARWRLQVLPPGDFRAADTEPLADVDVPGKNRSRNQLKVTVTDEALAAGTRFVVVVSALGEHGEQVLLSGGEPAEAISEEFQVVTDAPVVTRVSRRIDAGSLPEAAVRAAVAGQSDLGEDAPNWDLGGQIFGVRLGRNRPVTVRVSEQLIAVQRRALASPSQAQHLRADLRPGELLDPDALQQEELALPPTLRRVRGQVLRALAGLAPRDTPESVPWPDELRELVQTYLATYRRALDAAREEPQTLRALMMLDALTLNIAREGGAVGGVILLGLHPLRLAWLAGHHRVLTGWARQVTGLTRQARKDSVDVGLLGRVTPANLPFTLPDSTGRIAVYAEELTHGTGLYLVPGQVDSQAAARAVAAAVGLERAASSMQATSAMVSTRLDAYQRSHSPGPSLSVLAVHPGTGEVVAGAVRSQLDTTHDDEASGRRLDLTCYTRDPAYVRPVPALLDVQSGLRDRPAANRNHLFPALRLTVRPAQDFVTEPSPAHVAVVQDLAGPQTAAGTHQNRTASFGELLSPLVTRTYVDENGDAVWESSAAMAGSGRPGQGELSTAHRAHQNAFARLLACADAAWSPAAAHGLTVPVVRVRLGTADQERIRTAHRRADWVIGIDRFLGADLYEGELAKRLGRRFILDYAPDFVEGMGDRLTVTTERRDEVEVLLSNAMDELGLREVEGSIGKALDTLTVVSGRLALRLLGDEAKAREAVSLAALISHLRGRQELNGHIVIPVDAHPEIFGSSARTSEEGARRCDLLLVGLGPRSFKIACVEVKSRQAAALPHTLVQQITDQLHDTERLLRSRFFAVDPPRVDQDLQRARLAGLLHYYADRSCAHGLIARESIEDIHKYIDRIEHSGEAADITLHGYVIALTGEKKLAGSYGNVRMHVLTAGDLGGIGFTTRLHADDIVSRPRGRHAAPTAETGPPSTEPAAAQPPATQPSEGDDPSGGVNAADPGEPDPQPDGVPSPESGREPAGPEPDGADTAEPAAQPGEQPSSGSPAVEPSAGDPSVPGATSVPAVTEVCLGRLPDGRDAVWTVSTKGSPHAFIVGIPGQGKSVTTRRIIRGFGEGGLPSVVFDFHGDMAADPPPGAQVLDASQGLPFSPFEEPRGEDDKSANATAYQIAEVIGFVCELGRIQQDHAYQALASAYETCGWHTGGGTVPTLTDFVAAIEQVEKSGRGRNARERLRPLTDFGLFAETCADGFRVPQDHGLVLDLSKLELEEVQRCAASFLLRKVYREMFRWGQSRRMRVAVILDEAHRLAKDVTLPKIMKEGRKYGVAVVVASQSIKDFHKDVAENAGTKIVFRTNHPASKDVSGFLHAGRAADMARRVEQLDVGTAFVSMPAMMQAELVAMYR